MKRLATAVMMLGTALLLVGLAMGVMMEFGYKATEMQSGAACVVGFVGFIFAAAGAGLRSEFKP